ncbi:hypothetical protein B0H11DRAFT_1912832 [Mycena galericulata]|nr:hypothetical protein B0H11DRAFT_1912832 [Mycena galericulata]
MSNSTLGCAQNSDGTLREASEIQFFHDVDDQHPISGPSAAGSSSSPTHPFFTGTARPVGKIAGSRRSARQPRPSARISDPNNVEGSGSRSGKRKQASPAPAARKARRISTILSDAESSEDSEGPNDSDAAPLEDTEADDTDGQDAMDVDHYESIKAMGDADHARITSKLSRSDTTADINTVFTRMKDRKNPRTGVLESGALCQVCQKSGLPDSSCFLTGSVTTLRKHIARHDDHFKVYKTRCEKLGIKMNDRAIPVAASGTLGTQGSLDGIVIYEPRTPPFTVAGHRDYIIEMIVTQDEALSLVERPSFIRLIKYLRPGIKDSDIPTRNTIKKDILQHAKRVEEELRDKFKPLKYYSRRFRVKFPSPMMLGRRAPVFRS